MTPAEAAMRGRLALAKAEGNIARGRPLTAEEQLANLRKALDATADVVLAYRPKPKSRAGKARKRRAAKIAREKPRDG